jgi:hypothetical protein
MHLGDLQARVLKFRGQMRFGLLIGRQYIVSRGGLRRTRVVWYWGSGALVAHGLLRNHKETKISHSPTVSRSRRNQNDAVTALRELVLQQLRTTRGLPNYRKTYKTTHIAGWVVGWKFAFAAAQCGQPLPFRSISTPGNVMACKQASKQLYNWRHPPNGQPRNRTTMQVKERLTGLRGCNLPVCCYSCAVGGASRVRRNLLNGSEGLEENDDHCGSSSGQTILFAPQGIPGPTRQA